MKTNLLFLLITGLSPGLLPASSTTAVSQNSLLPALIEGEYIGRVYNGDNMDPVLTRFEIDASGQLKGNYLLQDDEDGIDTGEMLNPRPDGAYTLILDWKDKHGTGVVRLLFSADYSHFQGFWGQQEDDTSQPWNGRRDVSGRLQARQNGGFDKAPARP
ncbi:MAG TPA: hypothetical protein PLB10_06955 [Thiolinea sp.]|nr:hypothetical protein [Thiolinea sp.]